MRASREPFGILYHKTKRPEKTRVCNTRFSYRKTNKLSSHQLSMVTNYRITNYRSTFHLYDYL